MPKMVMQRKHTLVSTLGHVVAFTKGEPVHVPNSLVPDARAAGAVLVNAEEYAEPAGEDAAPAPATQEQRKEAIQSAFAIMLSRTERNDFTAAGVPSTRALATLTGFDVDAKERDALWDAYCHPAES